MLFSERRYADDLPMSCTVNRYLGCLAPKHWDQPLAWVESQISGYRHIEIHSAFQEMTCPYQAKVVKLEFV